MPRCTQSYVALGQFALGMVFFYSFSGCFPVFSVNAGFILILPVLFAGLRALHLHPTVFNFVLRVLFLSLGNPGVGVMGPKRRLGMLAMGEWWGMAETGGYMVGWYWRVRGEWRGMVKRVRNGRECLALAGKGWVFGGA